MTSETSWENPWTSGFSQGVCSVLHKVTSFYTWHKALGVATKSAEVE